MIDHDLCKHYLMDQLGKDLGLLAQAVHLDEALAKVLPVGWSCYYPQPYCGSTFYVWPKDDGRPMVEFLLVLRLVRAAAGDGPITYGPTTADGTPERYKIHRAMTLPSGLDVWVQIDAPTDCKIEAVKRQAGGPTYDLKVPDPCLGGVD